MEEEVMLFRKMEHKTCYLPKGKGIRMQVGVPNGAIERYKARLAAKDYTQTYRVDYPETFSPIAKIVTIRVLFSVVIFNWPLHQLDVKIVFLHGEIEVYRESQPGFCQAFKNGESCKLKRPYMN